MTQPWSVQRLNRYQYIRSELCDVIATLDPDDRQTAKLRLVLHDVTHLMADEMGSKTPQEDAIKAVDEMLKGK